MFTGLVIMLPPPVGGGSLGLGKYLQSTWLGQRGLCWASLLEIVSQRFYTHTHARTHVRTHTHTKQPYSSHQVILIRTFGAPELESCHQPRESRFSKKESLQICRKRHHSFGQLPSFGRNISIGWMVLIKWRMNVWLFSIQDALLC